MHEEIHSTKTEMIAGLNEHIRNERGRELFMKILIDRVADDSPVLIIPRFLIEMGVGENPHANEKRR